MRGPFKMTGTTCGGDGTYPTLDYVEQQERPWWESGSDEKGCQATGGYWGQVNGIDACVAPQPGETVQNDTTTTPGEGNKNTTTNPDGSTTETTTKETTSTDGGKATTTKETTTIYRNPDGSIANQEKKTETSEQPLSEFCKTNPAHPSCVGTKTDGSFAGSCAGGFKCSGDAVQCAIAEASHKANCAMEVTDDVLNAFQGMKNFNGTGEGEGLDRKLIDVDSDLNVTEIGGGTGLSDQSFTIMGKTIMLPFSEINRFIEMLGYAVMMIAWIQAFRIIAGVM